MAVLRRGRAVLQGKLLAGILDVAVIGAFALLTAPSVAAAVTAMPQTEDSPEAAFDRYRQLINGHDFDQLAAAVIAPDALFVFTEKTHRGIDEIRTAFNHTWSILPDEVYTMTDAQWLARDSHSALVAFRYHYRGTTKNGQTLSGGGHGTNLYKRTPAGWRLTYEHLSHDPKPAPAG